MTGGGGGGEGAAAVVNGLLKPPAVLQPASIGRPASRTTAGSSRRHNWVIWEGLLAKNRGHIAWPPRPVQERHQQSPAATTSTIAPTLQPLQSGDGADIVSPVTLAQ